LGIPLRARCSTHTAYRPNNRSAQFGDITSPVHQCFTCYPHRPKQISFQESIQLTPPIIRGLRTQRRSTQTNIRTSGANEEQVQIPKEQGSEAWNKWRRERAGIDIVLIGADLSGVNLGTADLGAANLSNANFRKANLQGANLEKANLKGATLVEAKLGDSVLVGTDLSGANLGAAELQYAVFEGANLSGANMIQADLFGAHFQGANLSGTNLIGANLSWTDLDRADLIAAEFLETRILNVDLSTCENLELTIHHGPSHIDRRE
jgi:uncharacterized protein YjbI with pentapeptide repeats